MRPPALAQPPGPAIARKSIPPAPARPGPSPSSETGAVAANSRQPPHSESFNTSHLGRLQDQVRLDTARLSALRIPPNTLSAG
jgi:hypothetical protein